VTGNPEVEIESVVGAGDLGSERVMLRRTGSGDLSLAGWQILEEGGTVYIFPQLNLYEGGAVTLYTQAGQSTVVELFWGLDKPLWESGETVILLDNTGQVRATYRVP
jgi:competence protein ComEC